MNGADLNGLSDGGVDQDLRAASKYTNASVKKKSIQERKTAKDLTQNEVAEMVFEMMISHRVMECRIEKLESRNSLLISLMMQKGINIPL